MWGRSLYLAEVAGLTYAEYVHHGFAQLTIVTALTLALIALTVRNAPQRSSRVRLLYERTPDDVLSWNLGRARAAEVEGAAMAEARSIGCT